MRTGLKRLSSTALSSLDRHALRQLLDDAFAGRFADEDWTHALGGTHAIVFDAEDAKPLAHACVVARVLEVGGRRVRAGYVEAVATRPDHRGLGLATRALAGLEETLTRYPLCALSTGRPSFYERLGWRRWAGPSWVRLADGARIRTPEEDSGLMVRAATPGALEQIDLTTDICCEDRPGDAW